MSAQRGVAPSIILSATLMKTPTFSGLMLCPLPLSASQLLQHRSHRRDAFDALRRDDEDHMAHPRLGQLPDKARDARWRPRDELPVPLPLVASARPWRHEDGRAAPERARLAAHAGSGLVEPRGEFPEARQVVRLGVDEDLVPEVAILRR